MRKFASVMAAVAACLTPPAVVAQSIPDIASIVSFNDFAVRAPEISYLGGAKLTLYKVSDQYFFVPNPIAEWATFNERTNVACGALEEDRDQIATVPLDILMYESSTVSELARSVDVEPDRVGLVPSYGYSIFYRIGNDPAVLLYSTLDPQSLLTGERLSAYRTIPRTQEVLVTDTCTDLAAIGSRAELIVSFHVLGRNFEASTFTAELLLKETLDFELAADQQAKQVDKTTIVSKASSGGFSFDVGPISFGGSKGGGSTLNEVEKYRVVDGNWVQSVVGKSLTAIDIQRICSGATCTNESVKELLTTFLSNYVEKAKATVQAQVDGSLKLAINAIPTEVTVTVDESLKQKLDLIMKVLNEKDLTVDVAEILGVGVKKKDDNTLQFVGGDEWTRKGEQWIPLSFSIDIVNETALRSQVSLKYSSAVLGGVQLVSMVGGTSDPFARDAQDIVGPTLTERIVGLEGKRLQCKVFENIKQVPLAGHTTATVSLPDGYQLAGGGCQAQDLGNRPWPIITESGPLPDERGWRCRVDPQINWQTSYELRSTAIGCVFD